MRSSLCGAPARNLFWLQQALNRSEDILCCSLLADPIFGRHSEPAAVPPRSPRKIGLSGRHITCCLSAKLGKGLYLQDNAGVCVRALNHTRLAAREADQLLPDSPD